MAALGSPGTTKEAAQGLGPGPWPCPAPWARTLAASFVVPGDPEAATGSPVFEYGSQVANFENRSVVTAYTKILKQLQHRHGHIFRTIYFVLDQNGMDFLDQICFGTGTE